MLPEIIDRSKTYYILTEEETERDLIKNRLIHYPIGFDENEIQHGVNPGLYITTKEYLHVFFYKKLWIRKVKIPDDAIIKRCLLKDRYIIDRVIYLERYPLLDYYFKCLFDKKTFFQEDYPLIAAKYKKYFDDWFSKEYFNYKDGSFVLAREYPDRIKDWYDPKLYNHKQDSWALSKYCHESYDLWYNPILYNHKSHNWEVSNFCPKHNL